MAELARPCFSQITFRVVRSPQLTRRLYPLSQREQEKTPPPPQALASPPLQRRQPLGQKNTVGAALPPLPHTRRASSQREPALLVCGSGGRLERLERNCPLGGGRVYRRSRGQCDAADFLDPWCLQTQPPQERHPLLRQQRTVQRSGPWSRPLFETRGARSRPGAWILQ